MGIPVLIMGPSGTGKSYSMRNFGRDEIGVVNVLGKMLPFRNDLQVARVDDFETISEVVTQDSALNAYIVDDFGYVITKYYLKHTVGPNKDRDKYAVFTNIAAKTFDLVDAINTDTAHPDRVVYLVMHDSSDDNGNTVPATVGKMLNDKINLVGMLSIVIQSFGDGERFGFNISKPPSKGCAGMFSEGESEIDNDLRLFDELLRKKYGLAPIDYSRTDKGSGDVEQTGGDRI